MTASTIRAGVLGGTGYTGIEVVRLLAAHPSVETVFVTARSEAGKRVCDLYPLPLDLRYQALDDVAPALEDVDVLFLCLPHGAAQEWTHRGLEAGAVVIDLSADHRIHDPASYLQWYGIEHAHPSLLDEAVYGLTEWRREALRSTRLVANPGCYPTSILLALAPLLKAGLLEGVTVISDSKSGVSGAGRTAKVDSLFCEVNENLRPYNVGHVHRHVGEIEQELAVLGGERPPAGIVFSPHLLPVNRGILSTIYVPWPQAWEPTSIRDLYVHAYGTEAFVRVLPEGQVATLAHVVHSNRCAISLHPVPDRGQLILVSTIDNLVKGAAGQAVQNMNVRFGLPETAGLA